MKNCYKQRYGKMPSSLCALEAFLLDMVVTKYTSFPFVNNICKVILPYATRDEIDYG